MHVARACLCATALVTLFAGAVFAQDIPYAPTPPEVVREMLQMARPQPGDVLVDLGSGDGRIVIEAARAYGIHGRGLEIEAALIRESNAKARAAGVERLVNFQRADLFTADISDANIVTLYLLPEVNVALAPRLASVLRPGARIVSHVFDLGTWAPDSSTSVAHSTGEATVYMWVVPARVDGPWSLTFGDGAQEFAVSLAQSFQAVRGAGSNEAVVSGRVRGDSLHLLLRDPRSGRRGTIVVSARVAGDRLEGTARGAGSSGGEWPVSGKRLPAKQISPR